MIASTHVFHFRSRADALRSLFADRRRLAQTPGLGFARLVFTGSQPSEGFNIGRVDVRRQMAMCLWNDEAALERFKRDSAIGRSWTGRTDEYCEVRSIPLRAHGSYRGQDPLASLPPAPRPDGPAVLWTFADIAPRNLWFFWSSIVHARRRLVAMPGLIAGTAGPERVYRGAMTFTIWDRLDEALGFAYREPPHKQIVKQTRAQSRLVDSMFIRMQPYAAEGRWPSYSRFAGSFDALVAQLSGGVGERQAGPGPLDLEQLPGSR
jgi:hypothetical protein